jgi:hypothetical protein
MNYLTQGMNSNHYDSIDEYIRALWSLLVLQLKTIISRLWHTWFPRYWGMHIKLFLDWIISFWVMISSFFLTLSYCQNKDNCWYEDLIIFYNCIQHTSIKSIFSCFALYINSITFYKVHLNWKLVLYDENLILFYIVIRILCTFKLNNDIMVHLVLVILTENT